MLVFLSPNSTSAVPLLKGHHFHNLLRICIDFSIHSTSLSFYVFCFLQKCGHNYRYCLLFAFFSFYSVMYNLSWQSVRDLPHCFLFVSLLIFWPCDVACGISVPQSGIEPAPPAVGVLSLNQWTAREVPLPHCFLEIPWWSVISAGSPIDNIEMTSCLLQLQTMPQPTSLCIRFFAQEPVYQKGQFLEVELLGKNICVLKTFDWYSENNCLVKLFIWHAMSTGHWYSRFLEYLPVLKL